jgi:hypothetical protein
MKSSCFVPLLTMFAISALLGACGTLPRLAAVPPNLTEQAVIPGIPNSRFWLDRDLDPFIQSVVEDFRGEQHALSISDGPGSVFCQSMPQSHKPYWSVVATLLCGKRRWPDRYHV